jgi:hypothetical protein
LFLPHVLPHEYNSLLYKLIVVPVGIFVDDSQEVMAKHGMGVLYTRTDDGRPMREVTLDLRERILKEYYWPHHKRLEIAVRKALDNTGRALIVDGHSFSDKPLYKFFHFTLLFLLSDQRVILIKQVITEV